METVAIQKLSKTYPGGKEALKQLSMSLSTGEVFGFLGPNGAGKTTTVKLLTGVLSPSGGLCEIMGVNPNIQPEKVHLLWYDISIFQTADYSGDRLCLF